MIERMNEKINIQQQTVTVDEYGNHLREWSDYFECWAYASTFAKDEEPDVTTTDQRGITFEVRFCSELASITSSGYRVIFHDEVYDIQSIDMMNWMRKTIKLKCRKDELEKVSTDEQQNSNSGSDEGGSGGTGELPGSGSGGDEQSG